MHVGWICEKWCVSCATATNLSCYLIKQGCDPMKEKKKFVRLITIGSLCIWNSDVPNGAENYTDNALYSNMAKMHILLNKGYLKFMYTLKKNIFSIHHINILDTTLIW